MEAIGPVTSIPRDGDAEHERAKRARREVT
jgi:hypothetical protein